MSSELFEEWVRELDRKSGSDKRKIALIIDSCEAQSYVKHLEWVELIFLPSNTISVTEPMDQGIMHSLKAKYRSLVVRRSISSLENKASMPAISILSALMWLSKAWNTLSDKTSTKSFCKCGISEEAAASAIADDGNPFAGLEEDDEDAMKTLETDLQFL